MKIKHFDNPTVFTKHEGALLLIDMLYQKGKISIETYENIKRHRKKAEKELKSS